MLIVLDGIDGVGKTTQVAKLLENFKRMGVDAVSLKFPYYEGVFGKVVSEYLRGDFGSLKDVHPKLAATVYLCNMRETRDLLQAQLKVRQVVILDRYWCSTIAYQCGHLAYGTGKLVKEAEDLATWIATTATWEFGLPTPDAVLQLDGPPDVLAKLIQARKSSGDPADIHEDDLRYQDAVRSWYACMANDFKICKHWHVIPVIRSDNSLLSQDEVAARVWEMAFHYCRDIIYPANLND